MQFFNRDLSWLSFNGRVLAEAGNAKLPLLERIRFLSIFSSNLDEFYRVRMPGLRSLKEPDAEKIETAIAASRVITAQQDYFGRLLSKELLPLLEENNIRLVNNEPIPDLIKPALEEYFFCTVAAFLQMVSLSDDKAPFFSENNQLYQVVVLKEPNNEESLQIISIPSTDLPRFFSVTAEQVQYIIFLEDIIQLFLPALFPQAEIQAVYNIKITRDAELDLEDEAAGELAEKIESKIATRDLGYATRFLYPAGMPLRLLQWLTSTLKLSEANLVEGARHHNLKDLASFPIRDPSFSYPDWQPVKNRFAIGSSIFETIAQKDRIIHTPYESYTTVLRFFSEAAIDPSVEEIYVTLYRIASDSRIAHALISAAANGKKVTVFVELKARFDEANNIRWGKKMKAAGIRIIYSIPGLKVHAKVALVKRRNQERMNYAGLFSTGNFNESTARFYTDHILFTADAGMLQELELLFIFLVQKRKPLSREEIRFKHLLVAQFNLQQAFLDLIDQEIRNAQSGLPASILIKLNNLEERKLIAKLYEAAQAGVRVELIVRSICCLQPGQPGISDGIRLTRIVDRYLEHGRVFMFNNNGQELCFLGSADWMNRNIYTRIEVCFPVHDAGIREELRTMLQLQLSDNVQAVEITPQMENKPVEHKDPLVRSQEKIYELISRR